MAMQGVFSSHQGVVLHAWAEGERFFPLQADEVVALLNGAKGTIDKQEAKLASLRRIAEAMKEIAEMVCVQSHSGSSWSCRKEFGEDHTRWCPTCRARATLEKEGLL